MNFMEKYNHKEIDKKWQKRWQKDSLYQTGEDKDRPFDSAQDRPKYYVLDMFPYPSGEGLHVGHPKGYIATDVLARFFMMKEDEEGRRYNVLHPMGWDAFGLPAENYALKNKVHPRIAVDKNITTFKSQLEKIGFTYDWDREINTTDPNYYKWTQWIFIKMYEKGLAYQSNEPINWCPSCLTGLANEDLEDGKCERCGSEIERKPMRQWVLRITDYADRLLNDLDKLEGWEESIKEMQRNWIGRSEGAIVNFELRITNYESKEKNNLTVFTTRPDTLFGCTYCVIAPEHPLIKNEELRIKNLEEVNNYIAKAKKKSDLERTDLNKDKTGVRIEGIMAINPVNDEEVPIFVADYVLPGYGTGAIMAVPAHDQRDFEFANKFNLQVKNVVEPEFGEERPDEVHRKRIIALVYDQKKQKILTLDWGEKFGGHLLIGGGIEEGENPEEAARREVLEETGYKNLKFIGQSEKILHHFIAYNKGVNRKAEMIGLFFELIDEEKDEQKLSPEEIGRFKVKWLSADKLAGQIKDQCHFYLFDKFINKKVFVGNGTSINSGFLDGLSTAEAKEKMIEWLEKGDRGKRKVNYKLKDWVFSRQRYWGEPIPMIHCPVCGTVPVPKDQLPVELPEVEHYEPSGTGESPLAGIDEWVNTKCPMCGGKAKRETNTMPQWAGSSWYYLRYIDPSNKEVFVDKDKEKYWSPVDFYVGGAEHATRHLIYARFWHKFLYDIGAVNYEEPFTRLQHVGLIMAEDGRKMSKRWGNVINPDEIVDKYGADALRVYEMFMGPFGQSATWSTNGLIGAKKFLDRIWKISDRFLPSEKEKPEEDSNRVLPLVKGEVEGVTESDKEIISLLHKTIKKISEDIVDFKFNTAVSQMMIFVNAIECGTTPNPSLERRGSIGREDFAKFIQLLAPFAPHLAEEIWSRKDIWEHYNSDYNHEESIFKSAWPKYDPELVQDEEIELVVQINGKLRDTIRVSADISEKEAKKIARESEKIQKWLEGKTIVKEIFVPGKLINIVIR